MVPSRLVKTLYSPAKDESCPHFERYTELCVFYYKTTASIWSEMPEVDTTTLTEKSRNKIIGKAAFSAWKHVHSVVITCMKYAY